MYLPWIIIIKTQTKTQKCKEQVWELPFLWLIMTNYVFVVIFHKGNLVEINTLQWYAVL